MRHCAPLEQHFCIKACHCSAAQLGLLSSSYTSCSDLAPAPAPSHMIGCIGIRSLFIGRVVCQSYTAVCWSIGQWFDSRDTSRVLGREEAMLQMHCCSINTCQVNPVLSNVQTQKTQKQNSVLCGYDMCTSCTSVFGFALHCTIQLLDCNFFNALSCYCTLFFIRESEQLV